MRVCSALPRSVRLMAGFLGLIMEAKQPNTEGLPPLALSPIEKAQKDGTALPISLIEITKLALQQNLDIAIQDTNEELNQKKIIEQFGNYDPQLTSQLAVSSSKSANTQTYDSSAGSFNQQDNSSWNFTFRQAVKTGGTFQTQWNTSRGESNSTAVVFNPNYRSSLTVQFTQPLWRNLKLDSNRANIKLANLDLTTSNSQFKQKVTDTIANIQTSYWNLVSAVRNYDIRRDSVQLAQTNLRDNRKKVDVGTIAPIEVTDAEQQVAAREVDLISAEEQILSAENSLLSLVSNDRNADIWKKVLVPTDRPDFKEYKVNIDTALNNALKNRPELEQAQISLQQLDIRNRLTLNNRKWQFDLTGQYGAAGNAGPQGCQKDSSGNCYLIGGKPILLTPAALVGGLGTSYKTIFSEGFTNWQVAFQITIPLRNRTIDSQLAEQGIQKRQQLMSIRKSEQSIQVEIRNALQTLESNRKQVESAGVARRFAAERLSGEQKRFEAGLSQNYLVLQRQGEVSSAEFSELQALIRYKQAITTLQKAMFTLVESSQFEIAKGSSSKIPNLK
jgi:outer membrane protein TolC